MVKRQKEKQYQSAREHRQNAQLRAGTATNLSATQQRLPFDCCALTLRPFVDPVCTKQGIVFDNDALLPFLLKHKVDPVTGKPMSTKDIITLHMDKDEEGRWQCPVLTKPFTNHSKVVAIIQHPPGNEANVYSYEAYEELNLKAKNYTDLTSGKKFHKTRDMIFLSDPHNDEHNRLRDISNFHHMIQSRKNNSTLSSSTRAEKTATHTNVRHSVTAQRIMDKIHQKRTQTDSTSTGIFSSKGETLSAQRDSKRPKIFTDDLHGGVKMTAGKTSGSFTSTAVEVSNAGDAREATEEEILNNTLAVMRSLKKKGYVTLRTNLGDLGLELHCDIAPKTCMNFIGLAEAKKYNGSIFHRLIKNFMIQGGKPPPRSKNSQGGGAKTEDGSLWGEPFEDEFDDRLVHSGPGILSMANAGPKTNKRQFFLTFKSCRHLDRKHSVFGKVVQGMELLQSMEGIPADKKDRPLEEIKIISVDVLVNPVKEAEEKERVRIEERVAAREERVVTNRTLALGKFKKTDKAGALPQANKSSRSTNSIGKYLPKALLNDDESEVNQEKRTKEKVIHSSSKPQSTVPSRLPPPPKKTTFGNFAGW